MAPALPLKNQAKGGCSLIEPVGAPLHDHIFAGQRVASQS